jgi:FAD:protein FMN transferase
MSKRFGLREAAPRWWAALAILVGLAAYAYFGHGFVGGGTSTLTGGTMGTTYRIVLGKGLGGADASTLKDAVEARLAAVNKVMSTYDPVSELSRFNASRTTDPWPASEELRGVVRTALEVSRASGGAFDVTVGPLVDAWGFGSGGPRGQPPSVAELHRLQGRVGYEKLEVVGGSLKKAHPELEVDLSGIAKGHAVDEVALLLEARGLEDYLVEIGGEVRVRGLSAQGRPFRVGIEEPDAHRRAVHLALALESGSLATSGNYRNFSEHDGALVGHVLDPSTGRPTVHRLLSASVWHPSCAVADAWATALLVVGPDAALSLAEEAGLEALLLIAGPSGAIMEQLTTRMASWRVDRDGTWAP